MSAWNAAINSAFDRADRHRPQDRDTLRAAALELRQRGLLPWDIAAALRLSDFAVAELLGTTDSIAKTTRKAGSMTADFTDSPSHHMRMFR